MSKALVKYKASVWGISKDRAREILRRYSRRNFNNSTAFKKIEGGNGNGNSSKEREISQGTYSLQN
jgi:hypothetical protein